MLRAASILLLFAPMLAAHPFDDRCDMVAALILQHNRESKAEEMVLEIQYRYETPFASYNEAYLSLDANRDESVSRTELEDRYKTLASDLVTSIHLAIRGDVATIEPEYKKFAFADLDNPDATVDQPGGMPVRKLRIGYYFYFAVKPAFGLEAGKHPVEFYLANKRVAITDPAQQLQAWDDRGPERKAIVTVKHDRTADRYDRLNFLWEIETATAIVEPGPGPTVPTPEDEGGKEKLIETDEQRHDPDSGSSSILAEFEKLRDGSADPMVWLVVLLIMAGYGAWHAIMPGHGKALVGSYLVATKGTSVDALLLGVVVAAAHTSGVYLLLGGAWAFRTMWPGVLDNPEKQLAEWIAFAVGLTIFFMGAGLVLKRSGKGAKHEHDIFGRHVHGDHDHDHHHHHHHHHDHDHDHVHSHDHGDPSAGSGHGGHSHSHGRDPARMSRGEILRLGILGGVIPCPSAFMIGLFAFQMEAELLGLICVLAFSVGLAAVLAVIGLTMVQGKGMLAAQTAGKPDSALGRFARDQLPVLAALLITMIGVLLVTFALIRLDLIDPTKFTV